MIACPVCSETAHAEVCASCGTDLTALLGARRAANDLAREAHELARKRQLERAADRAEQGMQLYRGEDLGRLFGWLLFFDGRISAAGRCWQGEIPQRARAVLRTYNEAVVQAQGGSWTEAVETLDGLDLPFCPGWVLRFVCTARLGARERAGEVRERIENCYPGVLSDEAELQPVAEFAPVQNQTERSKYRASSLVAGAVVTLMLGAGTGYTLHEIMANTVAPSPSSQPEPSAQEGSGLSDTTPPDSLVFARVFLEGNSKRVSDALEGIAGPRPEGRVQSIPSGVRQRKARGWYLEGLELFETDRPRKAVVPLRAAVASVGAASELYWVDDALYLLMRSQQESEPGTAAAWARTLLKHHDTSMYTNSVTRSVAAQTRKEMP